MGRSSQAQMLARGRAAEQMRRMAAEMRLARATLGLSRQEVARRAGVSRSTVERNEAADPHVQVDTLAAIMAAVGLDLVFRAYEGARPTIRDARHARLVEALRAEASGHWRSAAEVAAGDHGRAADLVLFGAIEILHCEIERHATDFQAQYRRAREKRDALSVRDPRPVRLVLVIEDTSRNRGLLRAHEDLISAQLPATSRDVLRSVRTGQPLGRDGRLWIRPRAR